MHICLVVVLRSFARYTAAKKALMLVGPYRSHSKLHCDDPVVCRLAGAGTMVGERDAHVAGAFPCAGEHIAPHNEHYGVFLVNAIAQSVARLHVIDLGGAWP